VHDPSEGPPTLPPGVDMNTTESGLEYFDVKEGTGPAAGLDSHVRVHYRCWHDEGRLLEDTRLSGQELEVVLGRGDVVAGLEEGLLGLSRGARRRLIVPSDLAYGTRGSGGGIPPNATLIYDVEVLSVRPAGPGA